MKVVIVASTPTSQGGLRFLYFARSLIARGHDALVISPRYDPETESASGSQQIRIEEGVPQLFLKVPYRYSKVRSVLRQTVRTLETIRRTEFDFVHFGGLMFPNVSINTMICRMLNPDAVVTDWDDYFPPVIDEGNLIVRLGWRIANRLQISAMSMGNVTTVVSSFLAEVAVGLGVSDKKLVVIPNVCDTALFTPIQRTAARSVLGLPDSPIVLVVGYPYPNGAYAGPYNRLFNAVGRAERAIPGLKLLMVGTRVIPSECRDSYSRVQSHMIECGRVSRSRLPLYMSAADLIYFPMEDSLQDRTRWPLRFSDSISIGRPIVSNAVGSVREVLARYQCGLIVGDSSEEISNSIVELLGDDSEIARLSANARSVAAPEFSLEKTGQLLESAYAKARHLEAEVGSGASGKSGQSDWMNR